MYKTTNIYLHIQGFIGISFQFMFFSLLLFSHIGHLVIVVILFLKLNVLGLQAIANEIIM